uniref:Cathepsin propeptide inhibitor domain-containing protein n=1 Tax=Clastoptera arizonana TaxID=38151 RepID=A0A1B6CZ63_9HEMI
MLKEWYFIILVIVSAVVIEHSINAKLKPSQDYDYDNQNSTEEEEDYDGFKKRERGNADEMDGNNEDSGTRRGYEPNKVLIETEINYNKYNVLFKIFIDIYGRNYTCINMRNHRYEIFKKNMKKLEKRQKNKKVITYKLSHYDDFTDKERKKSTENKKKAGKNGK